MGPDLSREAGAASSTLGPTLYIPVPHIRPPEPPLGLSQVGASPSAPTAAAGEGVRMWTEWFAQQPVASVCLELRSSLEYVTKFLSLSHNRSLLPASLAMRP